MNLELYLAFVLATAILIAIPGPTVTLTVATSMAHGTRHGLVIVAGSLSALAIQLAVVAVGMTSLMAALASWFEWIRWAGVVYLLWLGIQRWRADPAALAAKAPTSASARRTFVQGFLVALTNPKVLFFYAAFFPQFVDPRAPAGPQLVLLGVSFLAIAASLDSSYAVLAGRASFWLRQARRARLGNRLAGSILIGTAIWLALARRT